MFNMLAIINMLLCCVFVVISFAAHRAGAPLFSLCALIPALGCGLIAACEWGQRRT